MKNFRKINLKDDIDKISEMLLSSDNENYPLLFKEEKRIEIFSSLIKESKYFSYKNIYGYFSSDNTIVSSMMVFKKNNIFDEEKIKEILLRYDSYDEKIFNDIKNGYFLKLMNFHEDFYIYNLATSKDYLHQGYGKKLLTSFLNKYKDYSISLECLKNNVNAFNFYCSVGFTSLYSFKTYTYFTSDLISYHMVYSLKKEKNFKINNSKIILSLIFIFILLAVLITILILYLL